MNRRTFNEYLKDKLRDPKFKKTYAGNKKNLELGHQIFLAREAEGLTQAQLAAAIGTKQANICRMEMGGYNFTVEMLQRIAKAMHVDLCIKLSFRKKTT